MRTFQTYCVVHLSHFSGSIHNEPIESSLHPLLVATQQSHNREKRQPAVSCNPIESFDDVVHRFDFHPVSGLEIQALSWRALLVSSPVRPQNHATHPPQEPNPNSLRHFERATIAGANFAEDVWNSLTARHGLRYLQQFACLAKVDIRPDQGIETGAQLVISFQVNGVRFLGVLYLA
jgi:hypothetical protein